MYLLRFAYGGDHYIIFGRTTRAEPLNIAAIQSFQGIFRGRNYYIDQAFIDLQLIRLKITLRNDY